MIRCALAIALSIVSAVPAAAFGQAGGGEPVVRELVLDRPTVVAFLPASQRSHDEAQTPTPAAYATRALGRVKWCLGAQAASYHLFYADRIVIHDGEHDETFEISDSAPLPGALLLSPEAASRIVFAGGGAQSLVPLLREAASEYFKTSCRG
jgi:hypothetical protein